MKEGFRRRVPIAIGFVCECGRKVVIIGAHTLIHEMPMCDEFENMPPDEYVRRNRLRMKRGTN
jgi:hypothetical protein